MGYWCNYIVNRYVPTSESRQWQIPLAMQMIPSLLLFLVATFVLPESPRFLAKRGKKAQALKTLAFIRHLPAEHEDIQGELQGIQDAIERQELSTVAASRFGLIKELGWKGNRNRVAIGLLLMFGQNLTGINAINFYTPTIFKSIGFTGTEILLLASGKYSNYILYTDVY
jgi:MFS family permease